MGRLVLTEGALPAVRLVRFWMHGEDAVIRVAGGGELAVAVSNTVVALQADDLDVTLRAGWSVTVVGYASRIVDSTELAELSGARAQPWDPGCRDQFVRVTTERITGSRLASSESEPDGRR